MKMIKLNDEVSLPILGFGCWQLEPGGECQQSVEWALETGYRHIDTADGYGNHKDVALAIKNSGIKRDELFITTKIRPHSLAEESVLDCGKRFLEELETDYIDLLLIHWPNREVPIKETLSAMQKLKDDGAIRALGVSNFNQHHLEDALATGIQFSNNQIELHPTFNNRQLREFCQKNGIIVTSYSSNGRGQDLELAEIKELAEKYGKTPYQIILAWVLSQDILAIPRSTKKERIKENFESLEIELASEDIEKINNIEQNPRLSNPDWADFDY
jgi:2,5-diketo-D-gluconate reductase B